MEKTENCETNLEKVYRHKYNVLINRIHPTNLKLLHLPKISSLPEFIDLRSICPKVYDQGQLGSCTANALCGVVHFDWINNMTSPMPPSLNEPELMGSRLFLYYNERMLENTIDEDSGALLSDGVKCLVKYGICLESEWEYDISKFKQKPPQSCYINALKHVVLEYSNIMNDITSMKTSLYHHYPFVVGIAVYESFESRNVALTGKVPMPKKGEQLLGGHAVVCVGYDDSKKVWIMRNSWGNEWGDNGYFYLPYEYLLDSNLSSDLWNIKSIKNEEKINGNYYCVIF